MQAFTHSNETLVNGYATLPAHVLRLGAPYQRPTDMARVDTYAKTFDPSRLEIIDVSLRNDGTYWVVDGQHRVHAARKAEYGDMLLCKVNTGLTLEQEAERYVRLNKDRKNPTKLELFWARFIAGDEHVVAIKQIVEDEGFKVAKFLGGSGIVAIAAVEKSYKSDGGPILRKTLAALREAWGPGFTPSAVVLHAVSSFVNQYRDEYDHNRLVDVLTGITPRRLEAGVSAVAAEIKDAGGTYEGATTGGRFIQRLYNKGLRRRRLPEWVPGRHATFIRKPVLA